ncbi:hypothetical protein AB0F81_02880 [Actinoplanes sp. NPDC024001]|uniref:hypothetical protein n=1 Tax=Actinoplanes sp. NPDC024001 TaxID=3154598 RepID=UPI00340CB63E
MEYLEVAMNDVLRLGRDAAAWATGFYRQHFLLVFGLSMIPTVQRFAVVYWDPPALISITSEVLVAGVRILLAALIVRLMLAETGLDRRTAWERLKTAIDRRLVAFWGQWALLAIAFLIFDIGLNGLVAATVPADAQAAVNAVLVAVKNPTIIAFTLLWMAGIGRTLILGQREPQPA